MGTRRLFPSWNRSWDRLLDQGRAGATLRPARGREALFAELVATTAWRAERRPMYDRVVDVPRLLATLPDDGPGYPVLEEIRRLLDAHYATNFARVSLGYYRNGRDSVAGHGDTTARDLPEAVVATVSLGEPRRFLLRPRDGGRARAFALGWGDLIVMGGSCQRTWRHAIPKAAHAGPRIAVMYRPIWTAPAWTQSSPGLTRRPPP